MKMFKNCSIVIGLNAAILLILYSTSTLVYILNIVKMLGVSEVVIVIVIPVITGIISYFFSNTFTKMDLKEFGIYQTIAVMMYILLVFSILESFSRGFF